MFLLNIKAKVKIHAKSCVLDVSIHDRFYPE